VVSVVNNQVVRKDAPKEAPRTAGMQED
jgi:hypothetical protein